MLYQGHSFYMGMTVLEKQQERLKWLQHHSSSASQNVDTSVEPCSMQQFQDFFDHSTVDNWKREPEMHLGCSSQPNVGSNISGQKVEFFQAEEGTSCLEIDHCLSRTSSCQKGTVVMVAEVAGEDDGLMEKVEPVNGRDGKKNREAEFAAAKDRNDKKTKREAEADSKAKEKTSTENSVDSSKEAAKKSDYIHVRARRGQATDSHSLAERARREKISKKMKCLQDLVPGCNKITGRAGMLDEIINYVQSLQRQVEFLSMKLAAVTPRIESSTDDFSAKEFSAFSANYPTTIVQLPHLQVNSSEQPEVLTTDGNTGSSAFIPALDSSCFPVQPFWDPDMQNLHNMGFHRGHRSWKYNLETEGLTFQDFSTSEHSNDQYSSSFMSVDDSDRNLRSDPSKGTEKGR